MGSLDPNNPSSGGNGTDGGDGGNGQDGSSGGDAPPVQVLVALQPGIHPLLQVSVSASSKTGMFLVDPEGGSLTVHADGALAAQVERAEGAAGEAPAASERRMGRVDGTDSMAETVSTARKAAAGSSRSRTIRRHNFPCRSSISRAKTAHGLCSGKTP